MINYRVHTAPDGLVLKVEQELAKQSKRVGWIELPRLTPVMKLMQLEQEKG